MPPALIGEVVQFARRSLNALSAVRGEIYRRMLRKAGQRVGGNGELERFTFGDRDRQYSRGSVAEAGVMFVCVLRADLVAVIDGHAPVVFSRGLKSLGCRATGSHP